MICEEQRCSADVAIFRAFASLHRHGKISTRSEWKKLIECCAKHSTSLSLRMILPKSLQKALEYDDSDVMLLIHCKKTCTLSYH